MPATKSTTDEPSTSPFLRLPFEIRLMIYEYLLFPSIHPSTANSTSIANLVPDFHTYYSEDTNSSPFTLSVRTIDPWLGSQGSRTWRRRSTYNVRTGPFLTTTTPTTYRVLLSPYTAHLRHNVPSLLSLNRQTHAEASKVLYSTYTFSFHTSIEAAVPFLSDLTPLARSHIRHISLTKKALPYTKEFDRAEWSSLCEYLALHQQSLQQPPPTTPSLQPFHLRTLHLNIIAGKPDFGWDALPPITPTDFSHMMRLRSEWGGVDLEWAEQLMGIKGLREMRVKALVEHCARPVSEKQAFWVAFSKSVHEGGFGEWVRGVMVG
ncbi:Nn.00g088120.m01.CDS01 [Neocucurbitaria sp. VM-36]